VHAYRRGLMLLLFFSLINVVLGLLITTTYIHEPERDYYASNGVKSPEKLAAMTTPNMSGTPLLPPDPDSGVEVRPVPQ